MIETTLNEKEHLTNFDDMDTSEEKGERNLQYFERQKLPWLRTFLQERGIQTSSASKGENNGRGRPTQLLSIWCTY